MAVWISFSKNCLKNIKVAAPDIMLSNKFNNTIS